MRQHGTYVKYVVERCRCDECRAATAAYERARAARQRKREWGELPPIFVPAGPTRQHLFALSAAGIGPLQVEQLAGIGKTAQWKIRSQRVKRCLYTTEQAILAVTTDSHVFMRSKVDAAPAKAIVDELTGMGLTKTAIAKALGYKSPALQIPGGERCTLRTLRRLEVLRALVHRGAAV